MHKYTKYVNPYLGQLLEKIKMDKSFVKGEECYLYDDKGNKFLDFIAAYGALPFGYNPKEIWDTIKEFKLNKEPSFIQPSALNAAGQLAEKLIKIAPKGLKYVTFTNSGAETVEAAIKLCRSATGRLGILSTNNSFHGKTLGALSATGKEFYQANFGAPAKDFNYVQYGNLDELEKELLSKSDYYAAFIIEPIQGEGGIIEPPKGYLKGAKEICDKYGVKLILDEIQTGLGRTGTMFACEEEGVNPDVLLLAKALGGGIIPIGACLCNEEVYNEEFANKHSSTFAGNSLACRIGIKVLEKIDDSFLNDVKEKGKILKEELMKLKQKHPSIIKEVRGRGLMLGIEFNTERDTYPQSLLGVMAEQELLTPIISSYLLNVEKLRVAPTLNGANVIRIEPPLVITKNECSRAVESIESMLKVLSQGNTAKLLSHLINKDISMEDFKAEKKYNNNVTPSKKDERFAFLIHPIGLKNYSDFDESLAIFNEKDLSELTERWNDMVKPFVASKMRITSKVGKTAYGEFICVPRTAEELKNMPKEQALDELKEAIHLAKERGAKIVGLGAYTSVVSGGGLFLKNQEIPLTTGNSYTVVSAVEAVTQALNKLGMNSDSSTAAVIGATGSIGRGVAMLLSESVSKLILVGNPKHKESSEKRLYKIAAYIYRYLAKRIDNGDSINYYIYNILKNSEDFPKANESINKFVRFAKKISAKDSPIIITTELDDALLDTDIVVSATNNVGKLIKPDNLKCGAIVCDLSRPRNVSEAILDIRPDVLVIDGGIIEVPGLPSLGINLGFDEGLAYACMSETIMLALEGHYKHTSLGASGISIENILLTRKLANKHGFKLAEFRSFDKPIENARWEVAVTTKNC
ncbi:aminotransferase class III-fold pyridoxal phosphate-dependent enzyme [Caldisalinibacter kiritimatiensis]|uniref:Putative class-III aminotransferase n=1 Tax=Caldisalinibacter kiritimatiensis TaxID=1304284 RepID=R1CXM5_9FIRM|nr:aminotransferase class III-fold pyridoxal phosphate-dependent enzyme [Caldisalinibacter kiritimatiensis]EOD01364.1 putative class-III aminotransferase [Caldisalinibacter kiritimatiensis]